MIRTLWIVLLLSAAWPVTAESNSGAQAERLATTEQAVVILDWLEVLTAARQADRLIAQSVAWQTGLTAEQRRQLQARLIAATGSDAVVASLQAYVAQHSQADWARALQIYQTPMARRARNFEVALGLSMAADKFDQFQQQVDVSEARRQLVRRLNALLHSSEIAVLLQTELEISTAMLNEAMYNGERLRQDREQLALQTRQRQAYMAVVAENLFLYAYRFLKDDELKDFVEQMDDPAVRAIADAALKAFAQVLKAGRAVALTNS